MSHTQGRQAPRSDAPSPEQTPAVDNAESFIPLRRSDVLDLCAHESGDPDSFRELGRLLLALLHNESLDSLRDLKNAYSEFNPDRDTIALDREANDAALTDKLLETFDRTLMAANYRRLSAEEMDHALQQAAIIPLHTAVALDDYEFFAFYYRGAQTKRVPIKRFLRTREVTIEHLERVAVILRFKNPSHFTDKKKRKRLEEMGFKAGMVYLYLYKDVPKSDLELLFPNVEVSMTWRDKLMFGVPAIASAGPLLIKVLPSLGLIAGLILLMTMGPEFARTVDFDPSQSQALYPILAAALSTSFALGGFAVKQYLNYKNKKLHFQKRVTDTLFFKNLVTNRGVLFTVNDSADEALGKEMVLAYHHLLQADAALTANELDQRVQAWIKAHCDRVVDFNVHRALERLANYHHDGRAVVTESADRWSALPMNEAKAVLAGHWDGLFDYSDTDNASLSGQAAG